jgi:hypothetical protein
MRGPIDNICFRLRSSDYEHAVQILRAVCPKQPDVRSDVSGGPGWLRRIRTRGGRQLYQLF